MALEQYAREAGQLAGNRESPCSDETAIREVRILGVLTKCDTAILAGILAEA